MPRTGRERRRTPRTNALSETAVPHRHVHPARALKTRAPMTAALSSATSSPRLALGARGGRGVRRPSARWVSCASSARAREPDARGLLKRALVSTVAAATLGASAAGAAWASEDSAGLFAKTCAGCHAAGGNVVAAGATLFPADLERNGVNDADTIYDLIYAGKNKMPGYGEGCQPRGQCTFGARLSDDDIRGVAEYVLEQSKSGWK